MARTPAQQIADLEAKIARLRTKDRALENGQKIIVGSVMLQAARVDPAMRRVLLTELARAVTREVDKKRLAPLLAELAGLDHDAPPHPAVPVPTGLALPKKR